MSRKSAAVLVIVLLAVALFAVGPFAAADGGRVVSGPEARELVAEGALLVDVRTPQEFASGHIRGAINIPVGELGARMSELGDPNRQIIVYCHSGARSSQAAALLAQHGFEHVNDLGAYRNW